MNEKAQARFDKEFVRASAWVFENGKFYRKRGDRKLWRNDVQLIAKPSRRKHTTTSFDKAISVRGRRSNDGRLLVVVDDRVYAQRSQ